MTDHKLNIAIAGAGLLGRLFAWRLIKKGHRITLFEKNAPQQERSAAWTAAAMISPMSEVVVSERSIYDLGMQSMLLWESWLSELPQAKHLYTRKGSVVVAHPQDESELQQFYQELNFHLGSDNSARWINRNELSTLEPDLSSDFEHALYLPHEAHLHNRELLSLLLSEISRHCEVHWKSDLCLQPFPKAGNDALEDFDLIIDCRGLGAREQSSLLRGVRGEVLHVQTTEVKLSRPVRLMHPRYKLYVVPKPDNRYIIGATELESSDSSPISVQSALELCSALYAVNPAFAEARILEMDANLRPALQDNLPAITETQACCLSGQELRVIGVNGLYRHGYLIAPALVDQVLSTL